jgi:MFS transporter, OFA family, oxalate/formate antiporter
MIDQGGRPMSVQSLEYEQPAAMTRWWQLTLAMVAMMAASSPQYVWALFVPPLQAKLGVTLSALQVTFALFSICQCGLGPMHGYFAEKFTPRQFAAMGGALVGASWVLSSYVLELSWLYVTYGVLSGIGTGMIYVATVELVSRWFPERRGFAIGMVAGSYGFGAVITTFPIAASIQASGYQQTLMIYGIVLGIVSILVALGMRHPPIDPARRQRESLAVVGLRKRNYTSTEMLRTPIFWLMFVMMSMMATGGLMAISQIGAFARDFGITKDTLVIGMAALPLALTLDRVANGLTRPFFGWVSDRIGRENTMTTAFLLEGVAIFLMLMFGGNPVRSCCYRVSSSSAGARSIRCFPRSRATCSEKSTRPTISVFSWWPRPSARSLAGRSRPFCLNRAIPGRWSFPSSAVSTF